MKIIDLNNGWKMLRDDGYYPEASVPLTVSHILKENGDIPDPYFADNEKRVQDIFDKDYVFEKAFDVSCEHLKADEIILTFEMLDTLADVYLNGEKLFFADNMFIKYSVDVKGKVVVGENMLKVKFYSPVKYLEEHRIELGKPYNTLRKAGCMFGWDWGIRLPDSGIIGDVYLEIVKNGKIEEVDVRQSHSNGEVSLSITIENNLYSDCELELFLFDPQGRVVFEEKKAAKEKNIFELNIEDPLLWMPRGYGKANLYVLKAELKKDGITVSSDEKRIGLRTICLDRSNDDKRKGTKYQFIVNGTPVYFKGENLIITDADLANVNNRTWEKLIENSAKSNLNGIRVWGGAYYPPDKFYELCDENGLLVFQDFMFACTFYYTSDEFMKNVEREIVYQIKRLRHHPCICVLCGNNELDCIFTTMTSTEERTVALRRLFKADKPFDEKTKGLVEMLYSRLFLDLIPRKIKELSSGIEYTHSSPTSSEPLKCKSMFDYLFDGDMHYYLQYDGNAPYQYMREIDCRFMAEMGFQSYPSFKTIKSFCDEKDLSPYSDVIYSHQKCVSGNETIELYMKRDYVVPKNFEDYIYLSQLQAGEIMKYSVEHFRRHNDYNRGMIIWQLNDCWPVVSWSGIDYYGRWKAQQYYTKRFYSDFLVSVEERRNGFDIYVVADGEKSVSGEIAWYLTDGVDIMDGGTISFGNIKNESEKVLSKTYGYLDVTKSYLVTKYNDVLNVTVFGLAKEFDFEPVDISVDVSELNEAYEIKLCSNTMAKGVCLDMHSFDGVFSDNFFDLEKNVEKKVFLNKADTDVPNVETIKNELFIKTLNDVMQKGWENE